MRFRDKTSFAMTSVGMATLFGRIASIAFLILLAGIISIEDYGLFRSVISIGTLAGFFITAGATAYIARTISYGLGKGEDVSKTAIIGLIMQVLFFSVTVLILIILDQFSFSVLIVIVGLSFLEYTSSILRGMTFFGTVAIFHMLTGTLKLLFLVFFVYILEVHLTVIAAISIFSLSVIPAFLMICFTIRKLPKLWTLRLTFNKMKEGLRFAIPAILISVAHYSTINLAIPFANIYYGSVEAAYLSIAITFGALLTFIPSAVNFVIMPVVARTFDRHEISRNLKFFVTITAFISVIILISILIFREEIIQILFPSTFLPSETYFPLILTGYLFLAIATVFDAVWIGVNNLKIPLITSGIGAIVNLGWILTAINSNLGPIHIALAFFISRLVIVLLMFLITTWKREALVNV